MKSKCSAPLRAASRRAGGEADSVLGAGGDSQQCLLPRKRHSIDTCKYALFNSVVDKYVL